MERCKFQALVALRPGDSKTALGPSPCRLVVRAQNSETGESRIFRALVSSDGDGPYPPGSRRMLVTLRVAGDEIGDYLDIGSRFHLWVGDDVADGVVSRRLFV